jgi:hypothetical protein
MYLCHGIICWLCSPLGNTDADMNADVGAEAEANADAVADADADAVKNNVAVLLVQRMSLFILLMKLLSLIMVYL